LQDGAQQPLQQLAKHLARWLLAIPSSRFQTGLPKIMNTSPSIPDPEVLRKIAEEFQPAPNRIPFHTLKPYHEFIVMLRTKRASYRSVAELLEKQRHENQCGACGGIWTHRAGQRQATQTAEIYPRYTDGSSNCAILG
jgi:hypothetical protein